MHSAKGNWIDSHAHKLPRKLAIFRKSLQLVIIQTTWYCTLFEKLIFAQPDNKFLTIYWSKCFIILFIRSRYWTLSSHVVTLRFPYIHFNIVLQFTSKSANWSFTLSFLNEMLCAFLIFLMCAVSPVHLSVRRRVQIAELLSMFLLTSFRERQVASQQVRGTRTVYVTRSSVNVCVSVGNESGHSYR